MAVTRDGELVLLLAADLPLAGRDGGMFTHRHPGARLGVARRLGNDLGGSQFAEQGESLWQRLGPIDLEQNPPQVLVDGDRGVARGIDAAGDAIVDLAERDLVRDVNGGFQAGAAGLLDVVSRGPGRKPRTQHRLAGQVEVAAVLEHRAGRHLTQADVPQPKTGDQPIESGGEHVLVGGARVGAVGAGEGDAVAAEDRGAAQVRHRRLVGYVGSML